MSNTEQSMLSLFDDDDTSTETPVSESAMTEPDSNVESLLLRRRRQFLVHSFIYYRLNDSLISDQKYDEICKDLASLQTENPELSERLPFHDICSRVDESGSGFYITDYPMGIMATACHLLASQRDESFESILSRIGLQVLNPNG